MFLFAGEGEVDEFAAERARERGHPSNGAGGRPADMTGTSLADRLLSARLDTDETPEDIAV